MFRLGCSLLLTAVAGASLVAVMSAPSQAAARVPARTLLSHLTVAPERDAWTYDRDQFDHWTIKKGRCDARETVVAAESKVKPRKRSDCSVWQGRWYNEYSGRTTTRVGNLQVDHRVALAEAWRSGASTWSRNERRGFANDTTYRHSLLAVSAYSNQAKSDHDPAAWMPRRGKCQYAARWIAVKYRWGLSVDAAERTALVARLNRCSRASTMVRKPPPGRPEAPKSDQDDPGETGSGGVAPISDYDCPASHPIKGNANSMIYHVPGGRYYDITKPEECFDTESAAQAAGYRRSQQ